ncbi:bifunctional metallophosphatase/5'-nucleotidase [Streptomyces iconiensis]|uniref:Bifunctional metallophosphatase/5'-nucleotidase n=1 Tax=Streptomyces iconiensis TaxID=1384038 RepID=A0ABT6ZVE0_9ACTN|nr:bifunctional metallophosphatase/5'-nucleotidase [Streptomyces iconiensis]MDJ1133040.1 bifunctional metallophosphatase/5'-nucleotidase [Streptomyces iconiensis]
MHAPAPRLLARRLALAGGISALALLPAMTLAPSAPAAGPGEGRTTPVQLLAVNDLHGNLDAVEGPAGAVFRDGPGGKPEKVQAGGVPRLATLLDRARADAKGANSLTVGAGDMIGGSPLLSAAFHDEPTVEALETMGLDVTSVGNHEFDEGPAELRRMKNGGCHPEDGCAEPDKPYDGTDFPYLAANVLPKAGQKAAGAKRAAKNRGPILPPYWIKKLPTGERVGFIGLTTKDTPAAVSASMTKDLVFEDEVATLDKYAEELDRKGVKSVVALVHEGAQPKGKTYDADCDKDGPASGIDGRIKGIASKTSSKVDMFVTGHSHEPYVCTVNDPAGRPRLVTQAASFGRTYTDLRFDIDRGSGDIVRSSASARNHIVTLDTPAHPAVSKTVERWRARSADLANKPVGYISGDIPGRGSDQPETPLGDLITDTQVEATRGEGAELALLNWGGMRSDLVYRASGKEGDGVVTYGEAFQVQPFDNPLVTMTLTGKQLMDVLRQQFSGANEGYAQVLQISSALKFDVDMSRQGAERLRAGSVRVNGKPVDASGSYRVTVNDFLAEGGNGFTVLKEGTHRESTATDLAAFTDYLKNHSSPQKPIDPPAADRITFQ